MPGQAVGSPSFDPGAGLASARNYSGGTDRAARPCPQEAQGRGSRGPLGVTGVLTPSAFAKATGVSRETLERLEGYAALLTKWQKTINLVARDSLADLWRRHMLDSAALWPLIPKGSSILV